MKSIIYFAVGVTLTLTGMFGFWVASLGRYDGESSSWLADVYVVKESAARSITAPKVIVVSGSNAMFGIDSDNLSRLIGTPVLNMASHAGLPLPLLVDLSIEHVNSGDVVVAPLEFEYYRRDPTPSLFEATNVESWAPDYALSTVQRAALYFRSASMLRSARQLLAPIAPPETTDDVKHAVARNTARGVSIWSGYSAKSLKSNGDMLIEAPNTYHNEKRNYLSDYVNERAIQDIVEFKQRVENKGARFVLTWPVTMLTKTTDFRSAAKPAADALRAAIATYGLSLECDPVDFQFTPTLFADTEYHMSLEGAERRTVALAKCLTGRLQDIDPIDLVKKRRAEAAAYDQSED